MNLQAIPSKAIIASQALLASVPGYKFPFEQGVWWIFSPRKHLDAPFGSSEPLERPSYYVFSEVWGGVTLDLRVVGLIIMIWASPQVVDT